MSGNDSFCSTVPSLQQNNVGSQYLTVGATEHYNPYHNHLAGAAHAVRPDDQRELRSSSTWSREESPALQCMIERIRYFLTARLIRAFHSTHKPCFGLLPTGFPISKLKKFAKLAKNTVSRNPNQFLQYFLINPKNRINPFI